MAETSEQLDNELLKKTLKNLKLLNIFMAFMAVITVISILVFGAFLFVLINFLQDITDRIDKFQKDTQAQLNVKDQICADPTAKRLLSGGTFCTEPTPAQ